MTTMLSFAETSSISDHADIHCWKEALQCFLVRGIVTQELDIMTTPLLFRESFVSDRAGYRLRDS